MTWGVQSPPSEPDTALPGGSDWTPEMRAGTLGLQSPSSLMLTVSPSDGDPSPFQSDMASAEHTGRGSGRVSPLPPLDL
eukprot:CAMPEP_0174936698 /NCGR_PEP_ID=MMETSP1355-20121228/58345_1 /TAXON_ID=464990 /ORGANISM="Hemiselmis tepida, Strain CCMP443" /LENGTH=78 /DNA_ID=CAMNT_0016183501 /DNA_START=40 /DNA_END=276 /DNA_ORIENTATION=+